MVNYNIQEAVKRVAARAGHQTGLTQLVRRLADAAAGPRLLILMYHRIADEPDRFHHALPTQAFIDQIAYVAKHYPCLTENEVCDYLEGRRPLKRTSILVTFDDGYRDTATIAQPILKRHGVPASVFLATSAIGTGKALWPDRLGHAFKVSGFDMLELDGRTPGLPARFSLRHGEERIEALKQVTAYAKSIPQVGLESFVREIEERLGVHGTPYDGMLSWDEVIALDRGGVAVGGHTINHQTLSRLPLEMADEEIRRSKTEIEQRLGHSLKLFCYPNGTFSDITPAVKRLVQRAGFVAAVAAEEGANDHRHSDLFSLLRVPAYQKHTGRFAVQLVASQLSAPTADRLPTGLRVEVVDTVARLDELASKWEELVETTQQRSFFLRWDWVRTWWEVFGADKRLWVLAVWHPNGRLLGFAPWYVGRELVAGVPCRVLRWLGDGEAVAPEYLDLISRPEDSEDVAQAVAQFLMGAGVGEWDAASLRRVRPQSQAMRKLRELIEAGRGSADVLDEPLPCPYIDLPETWEAYYKQLSPNMQHNIARRRKKLDKEFPDNGFTFGAPDGDARQGLLALRELHLKRKATQGIDSPFARQDYLDFHLRLAERLAREERLYLSFLSIAGAPVAAQYGFRENGTLYAYQTCFDPAYGKNGVAQILLGYILQTEIQLGTKRIDFLRGDEPYKYDWTQTEHRLARIEIGNRTAAGRLATAARRSRAHLRGLRRFTGRFRRLPVGIAGIEPFNRCNRRTAA